MFCCDNHINNITIGRGVPNHLTQPTTQLLVGYIPTALEAKTMYEEEGGLLGHSIFGVDPLRD